MQSCKYKLVIFDMDGTILDTSQGILQATRHTIETFHKSMPSDDVLKSFIGPPLRLSFAAMPDVLKEEVDGMVKTFRKQYSEKELFHAVVYDGFLSLCQKLKLNEVQMAVATNKPERFAKQLVQHFALGQYIPIVCGADEQGAFTKVDLIYKVMDLVGIEDKSQVVMVGDTSGDADAAGECGIDFIGVTYGFGFKRDKAEYARTNAIRMVSSPLEIYEGGSV